jgi:hypothetical protein
VQKRFRSIAIAVVGVLAAGLLTGCVYLAKADDALSKFSAFATSLDGVTEVTAKESAPTNVSDPFSADATGRATVVLDEKGWQERIGTVAQEIVDEIGGPKRTSRITLVITLFAEGNRVELGYDRAENEKRIAFVLDATKDKRISYVEVASGPRAVEPKASVVVGRAPDAPLAAVIGDWGPRAQELAPGGHLTVTTREPAAKESKRVSPDLDRVPSDRTVALTLPARLEPAASDYLTLLDTTPGIAGFDVEQAGSAAPGFAALGVTRIGVSDLAAVRPIELRLRANPGFPTAASTTFAFDRVRMVSEADDATPTRVLLPSLIADPSITRIALGSGTISIGTAKAATIERVLEDARSVPGTDALRLSAGGGYSGSDFANIDLQQTPFPLARALFPSLAELSRQVTLDTSFLRDDGAIDLYFGSIDYDRKLLHTAIDAIAPAATKAGVAVSVNFAGVRDQKKATVYSASFTAQVPLTVGEVRAGGRDGEAKATADLVEHWNRAAG